jgi:hypothetical protein
MADCATPSTLLLLFIIRLLIAWAEGVTASLRERTETADLTDLLRACGTTDTALILQRFTHGLQRLRALEAEVLRGPPGLNADPQLKSSTASARSPSASQPRGLTPAVVHLLPAPALTQRTATAVRATGPPAPNSARANRNGARPSSHTKGHGRPRHADFPSHPSP